MSRPERRTLITRVATVSVVLPLFLAALFYLPNVYWMVALLVPLALAAHEWSGLARLEGRWKWGFIALVVLPLLSVAALPSITRGSNALIVSAASLGFWLFAVPAWLALKATVRSRPALAAAGWLVLVPTWYALAIMQANPLQLLLLLGVIWISDSAAYFSGSAFGKRRLAPAISPGKTWEGVAGAVGAVTVYYAVIWFIVPPVDSALRGASGLAVTLVMVTLGIEGDLFESWMKRQAGVKDSGSVLPGHGGVLDRIDSLTAAMPAAALALALVR